MIKKKDLPAIFHEMHRSIEESATEVVKQILSGKAEVTYPPNGGLKPDEIAALKTIPNSAKMKKALRKMIADAAAYPVFHLFCLLDGVADLPEIDDLKACERTTSGMMLHDALLETYWEWRDRRPDPGWRLDCCEDSCS